MVKKSIGAISVLILPLAVRICQLIMYFYITRAVWWETITYDLRGLGWNYLCLLDASMLGAIGYDIQTLLIEIEICFLFKDNA